MSRVIELPTIAPTPSHATDTNHPEADALAAELRRKIRGEVRFDHGSRALYATDLSMYRQVPIGVVIPRSEEDVIESVAACRRRGVPLLGRGSGTSLAGQTCNVAVIIDFSKYLHHIQELNPDARIAWVEPGVICDQLRDAAEQHQLTFAPDPATHRYCTIGGMIGNNSCGAHAIWGGATVHNVEELDILLYDGTRMTVGQTSEAELEQIIRRGGRRGDIYRRLKEIRDRYGDAVRAQFPNIPRRVSGLNLDQLLPEKGFHVARALVGSESICTLVLRAKVRLIPSPQHRALFVIGYDGIGVAAEQVPLIREYEPLALEGFHEHVIENMHRKGKAVPQAEMLPPGDTWLLVEVGGESQAEAADKARAVMAQLEARDRQQKGMKLLEDKQEQKEIWAIRESGVGSSRVPHVEDAWPGWEDAAVAPEKLGGYLRDLMKMMARYGYAYTLFGHFGEGCIHTRITFDTRTAEGVRKFRSFMEEGADLVVSYGGSITGEHGDGHARAELWPKMFGPDVMTAFREFKEVWDPDRKMNPGKLVDPYPLDSHLRIGPDYNPRPVMTYFQFPEDKGSMAAATERCFGIGKCRGLHNEGTMCPSFMATREEAYTTRGRAHLLFEMLRGETIPEGWQSEAVKDSLDLCLACKGCKGDCPVNVDIATYKAEFLAHYYESKPRPLSAYSMGLIGLWAPLASCAPTLANFLTQTPLLSSVVKLVGGLSLRRQMPAFARETFRDWFQRRPPQNLDAPPVILWADTFNNHFHPEVAQAAVEVLEAAGRRVLVPMASLCCGRPLYDYGMVHRAKAWLQQILEALRPAIRAGIPLVGLEPSCLAVFRDEMINLFPHDEDARRLGQQSYLLSELLVKQGYRPPRLQRRALVHGHCHHKALIGMEAEQKLLSDMGLDFDIVDSGCCGLAGSFGFEPGHYDVSMAVGERVLLPAVRRASSDTLVVTDGFSCREQIHHGTGRQALHLAQLIQMALRQAPYRASRDHGPSAIEPRIHRRPPRKRRQGIRIGTAALLGVGALAGGLLAWRMSQEWSR